MPNKILMTCVIYLYRFCDEIPYLDWRKKFFRYCEFQNQASFPGGRLIQLYYRVIMKIDNSYSMIIYGY